MAVKSKKPRKTFHILVDMDEVTCDLQTPWTSWINENGDPDFHHSKIKNWNTHEYTSIGKKCYEFLENGASFLDLKPIQGALEHINKLRVAGHTIQFCTADPIHGNREDVKNCKIEWLKHYFKWFNPETDIVFSNDKGSVPGDILFDDRAKWGWEFDGIFICMDKPYNKDWTGYRVTNWEEFTTLVKRLSHFS